MPAKNDLPQVPTALADVALIDGPACAAAGAMSLSSWHAAVADGTAPAPAIRAPRFTRWRIADVRQWLIDRTAAAQADAEGRSALVARAANASARAREPAALAKAQATRRARSAARRGVTA